jgi:hypothetical protein
MLQQTEDCLTEILKHKKSEFQDSSFELEKFENILRLTQSASSTLQLLLMQQISDKNQTLIQIK